MIRGALAWITANLMFKQVSAERCCKPITRLLWESTTDMSTTVRLQRGRGYFGRHSAL
jgi:hypothetical protein